jgi:hypothetical protein
MTAGWCVVYGGVRVTSAVRHPADRAQGSASGTT